MGKLSPRERKLLVRGVPFCAMPLPAWPCFTTGWTVANVLSLFLLPLPKLAQITLAMVSNRFLISNSCLAIPWKIRVGAS